LTRRLVGQILGRVTRPRKPSAAPNFSERFAKVNGVRLRYLIGGTGSPVVLLHGYAETSHMWRPILPALADSHTVIVPDLRGAGGSAKPASGYDKKTMAMDIHELTSSLKLDRVRIVGHDIGLMVAYAYAAQFPQATDRVVLMDAFLPGIGNWKNVWLLRDMWHFHFYGDVPLQLVKGRERIYLSISGTTLPPTRNTRSPRPTAASTRRPTRRLEPCAPGSSISAASNATRRTLPGWPRRALPCRCWCYRVRRPGARS
jgi:pimeloyl-ACP methyl ester carboxylesterase